MDLKKVLKAGEAKSYRPTVTAWWARVVESPLDDMYLWYLYHGDTLIANGKNAFHAHIEAECQAIIRSHQKGHTIFIFSE